jgi:Na+-transporting NADH:ubiquinone oxidoreductase subunit NqrB
MKNYFLSFVKDARNIQILILSAFLFFGMYKLDWGLEFWKFTAVVMVSVATQITFNILKDGQIKSIQSAIITGLGLCLLLQTNAIWVSVFAAIASIAVKFLLKSGGRHFFNPSNFGIVFTILITNEAWVSPGQWGSGAMTIFLISAAAMIITIKVRQLGTGIAFIATLFVLEYLRTVLYLGWEADVLLHKFANGSLLLFTFFMITDPISTPQHPRARLIWACAVAILTFTLSSWFFLHAAPIYALFMVAPLTPILNRFFPHTKFQWINSINVNPSNNINYENQIISATSYRS